MPQLDQLSDVLWSQLFWLSIVLGFIYFAIGRGMVPKIQATVDARDQRIADDLAAAERAKGEAEKTEEAYRARMDDSRGEALKRTTAAKQKGALETEKRLAAANLAIQAKASEAGANIRASRDAALAKIEDLAADLVQDITGKVAGLSVGKDESVKAVKAAMSHG